jgi:hypothetical protein
VRDSEIDAALAEAARVSRELPAELLERIADSIKPSLQPVRPLPATSLLTAGLILIVAAVAFLGAARAGFQGVAALDLPARVLIFGSLAILGWSAAGHMVREWIPGSARRTRPAWLCAILALVLLAVFGSVFRDYRTDHFASSGLTCLFTGLLHAAPAALLAVWLLRRGWVVNPVSAGFLTGLLAALAGVSMLELHCSNFQALHVLVWHTLVVPVSGAMGAFLGWLVSKRANGTTRSAPT